MDGLILVDLPLEHAGEIDRQLREHGMHLIRMSAPTSEDARLADTLRDAGGFVYHIMLAGTTGAELPDEDRIAQALAKVRAHTGLPVAAGFGVRTPAGQGGGQACRSGGGRFPAGRGAGRARRARRAGGSAAAGRRVAAVAPGRTAAESSRAAARVRNARRAAARRWRPRRSSACRRRESSATCAQPVTDPEGQEQRDRQIGGDHADPVDALFLEGLVVLAQRHQQAQHEGQQRAEGNSPAL